MERKTIENDEEYLRQVSKEVSFDDEALKGEIEEIERFCKETECFALAAVRSPEAEPLGSNPDDIERWRYLAFFADKLAHFA